MQFCLYEGLTFTENTFKIPELSKMTVVDKLKQKVSYKAHIFVYLGLNI